MRILWLSHVAELGGATFALAEGVDALAERGHRVDVVMPEEGRLRGRLAKAQTVVVQASNRWIAKRALPFVDRGKQAAFDLLRAGPALARMGAGSGVDVVVTNTLASPVGAIVASRLRRPHVWYLHEFGDLDHDYRFVWGKRLSLLVMRKLSSRFLVNSQALRRHFAKWLGHRPLRVVPYSVDVEPLPPSGPDSRRRGPLRLIQVGTRCKAKGQVDAVRAAAILLARNVDVELELVGGYDPDYDALLKAEIERLALRGKVRLLDFDPQRLHRVAAADIAVVCSPCEAFGRFTVEAMKLGKPVVGATGGATPELVRDGENGFGYTPGQPDQLADRVERFARQPSLISELGNRGSLWANRQFNRERFGAELEDVLEDAIRGA
jgi:glycosyltransferase involved in cell wall biosynthesis